MTRELHVAAWVVVVALAVGVRLWNALAGPLMWGYDAWGHVAYVLFLDLYRAVPWADQGWSYFHPPFHYGLGWILAQFGSGDVLMRGLSLLGSAFSLATAAIAASLVRAVCPERPGLVLVAFGSVAMLPVHLFMSPMPGNELTRTFLVAAALAVFIANERRAQPLWSHDAFVGALLGLALLTKFSGLLGVAIVVGALIVRAGLDRAGGAGAHGWPRALGRAACVTGLAFAISAPYYARNLATFGTPFQLSRDFALVTGVERDQPPGERSLRDYVYVPATLFANPNPLAPDLLGSVWGTVYLDVWADIFRESDVERALVAERAGMRSSSWMAAAGLLPTGLALFGFGLAVRDVLGRRRLAVYVPLLLAAAGSIAAFAIFTWQVPIWSALKSSYLLDASLPFGVFLARALEAIAVRTGPRIVAVIGAYLAASWLAAGILGLEGVVLERRADAPATGAVRFYFGEYDQAQRVYGRLLTGAAYKAPWLDNMAAVHLAVGDAARAQTLYARAVAVAVAVGRPDPYRIARLSVATALAGDVPGALARLDADPEVLATAEGLANRGALRMVVGDPAGAEADLRAAVARNPELTPAWKHLTLLFASAGREEEAAGAVAQARASACGGRRGYPHGVGTGEVLEWGVGRRWLLLWDGAELSVATPAWYRKACRSLTGEGTA